MPRAPRIPLRSRQVATRIVKNELNWSTLKSSQVESDQIKSNPISLNQIKSWSEPLLTIWTSTIWSEPLLTTWTSTIWSEPLQSDLNLYIQPEPLQSDLNLYNLIWTWDCNLIWDCNLNLIVTWTSTIWPEPLLTISTYNSLINGAANQKKSKWGVK